MTVSVAAHRLVPGVDTCAPGSQQRLLAVRLERACRHLRSGRAVTEVAMEVGYKTTAHFFTRFMSVFGMSPSEVRSGPVHD